MSSLFLHPIRLAPLAMHSWDGQSQDFRIEYLKHNKYVEPSTFKTNGITSTFTLKPSRLKHIRVFISNKKKNPQISEVLLFRNE